MVLTYHYLNFKSEAVKTLKKCDGGLIYFKFSHYY